jgi:hypothetical protein
MIESVHQNSISAIVAICYQEIAEDCSHDVVKTTHITDVIKDTGCHSVSNFQVHTQVNGQGDEFVFIFRVRVPATWLKSTNHVFDVFYVVSRTQLEGLNLIIQAGPQDVTVNE